MEGERYSCAMVTATAVRQASVVVHMGREFAHALGQPPVRYEWRFIPEGEFLFFDEAGKAVLAWRDMAEVVAFV